MKKLFQYIGIVTASIGITSLVTLQPVLAIDPLAAGCDLNPSAEICQQKNTAGASMQTLIRNIISTLLFVLGIICVIVIIVAGIQYAVAGGDAAQITRAKNSILYAVVGLVVALLAYAIVNFVLQQFR